MSASDVVIEVDAVSKLYRLGEVSTGTISHDLNRWWYKVRGKADPYLKLGEVNERTRQGASDYVYSLRDVSFNVKHGEVLGIIGRNGAGKSTLLKILSRVTSPTAGCVRVRGRIASLLEVGTGFHPELTGRENIYLNGAILGMRRNEITRHLDAIIDFSGCERYVDTPVKRYSSGMYVRLAFAVAAHLEPDILIVDEVLAVGDAAFQKKCLGKMNSVASEGRTVLFVSHNMPVLSQLCPRALLLDAGSIVSEGSTSDVIHSYLTNISGESSISAAHCAISPSQHDSSSGGASIMQLRSVRLLGNRFPTFAIHWKEPISFEIELEAKERLTDIYFGLAINTHDGTSIFATHSNDRGQPLYAFEAGVCKIIVQLENPLRAGYYNLSIAAAKAIGRTTILQVAPAVTFEILELSMTGENHPNYRHGSVNGRSEWSSSISNKTPSDLTEP